MELALESLNGQVANRGVWIRSIRKAYYKRGIPQGSIFGLLLFILFYMLMIYAMFFLCSLKCYNLFIQRSIHNSICSNALLIEYIVLTIININVDSVK